MTQGPEKAGTPLWDVPICTGCGWDSRVPVPENYLACCPDHRYRTPKDQQKRIEQLEFDAERAYQMLEVNGVPRERAKSVANGIDVLIVRMGKELAQAHPLGVAQG